MRQLSGGRYLAEQVTLTPCDCAGTPDYELLADSAEIDADRAHLHGVDLRFAFGGKIPLFPLSLPLTSRQSGVLAPQPGFGGPTGFTWAQPVFFTLGPSYDLTLTAWEKAQPAIKAWAAKGKPYIPWAAKPSLSSRSAAPSGFVTVTLEPTSTEQRRDGWTESRVHKSLVIRTQSMSAGLIENVRRVISELAPDSPVFGVRAVEQTVSNSARTWSVLSQLLGLFAAIALILAAIGIYGVMSYSVSERSHELGMRMALGAQPKHVVRLVLGQAMTLSFLGVVVGLSASFAAVPLLARFLYGVKPHDVLTLVLVSSLLIVVTLFASYIPARHATAIDPMKTLRHD